MNATRYREELLNAFEVALQQRSNLITYLEPSHSTCGIQESMFRILILCRSSQAKAFDLLLNQLESLQKEGQSSVSLSHLCIAQIRFINRIYDSHALFCSVFEREIEQWTPEVRNSLISSIPEVLTDVSVQLEAVQELQSLLLRDVKVDPVGCKLAVITALSLLNSEAEATKQFQKQVMQSIMKFDVELLPSLVELLLRRLDCSSKNAFAELLFQLSSSLQIDKLQFRRRGKV
ncbi:unnamed protein product [Strongylus vulgaris]|uniref:Uncharacterized protein n=1 Tax=Strongylus vulgaris TaxID=40348 RepID=A0A3P7KVN5_STRVU|nr:unnamed protein product [Strongylus vulgaris]